VVGEREEAEGVGFVELATRQEHFRRVSTVDLPQQTFGLGLVRLRGDRLVLVLSCRRPRE
jgi:hypothetical protein